MRLLSRRSSLSLFRVIEFLGGDAILTLALSFVVGLGLVAVELVLGFGLQGVLFSFGILEMSETKLPPFFRDLDRRAILLFFCLAGFARAAFAWLATYLPLRLFITFLGIQRRRIIHWAYHEKSVSPPHVIQIFNEKVDRGAQAIRSLLDLATYGTSTFCLGVILILISPELMAVTSLALLLLAPPFRITKRICRRAGDGVGEEWRKINSRLVMGIRNLFLLRVTGMQGREAGAASASLKQYTRHYLTYAKVESTEMVLPQLVAILMVSLLVGAHAVSAGGQGAILVTYLYLLFRFLNGIGYLASRASAFVFLRPHITELYRWYVDHGRKKDGSRPRPAPQTQLPALRSRIGWHVKNLSFTFPGEPNPALENIDLTLSPGSTTVILGPSGAGKSTLLYHLIGEYTPASGTIELDWNTERFQLRGHSPELLANIGYVGAESFLFEGTIRENLLYGLAQPPASDEIDAVLETAECQFVSGLTKGLDHFISDQGEGLSAGQKQRLCLARALLRRPRALLLDEVTANLDHETERRIVDTLANWTHNFTIVAVTHRHEFLRIADQIIELDHGKLVVRQPLTQLRRKV